MLLPPCIRTLVNNCRSPGHQISVLACRQSISIGQVINLKVTAMLSEYYYLRLRLLVLTGRLQGPFMQYTRLYCRVLRLARLGIPKSVLFSGPTNLERISEEAMRKAKKAMGSNSSVSNCLTV